MDVWIILEEQKGLEYLIANELSKDNEVHIISINRKEEPYFEIDKRVKVKYLEFEKKTKLLKTKNIEKIKSSKVFDEKYY